MKQFDVYVTETKYLVVFNICAESNNLAEERALEKVYTGHCNLCSKSFKITDVIEIDKFNKEENSET